jgi:mannosyltransferase OCH1-like enzyme
MIPKLIHYCWFGPKEISDLEKKCIASWHKFLPGYTLHFWNEDTFNIQEHVFTRQAYEAKYYAFVSDFVRAKVLMEYGGIYLDTDLEVLMNFENLLKGSNSVFGFENSLFVGTAFMATTPKHEIFNAFYSKYKNNTFNTSKGKLEITANPAILAEVLKDYGVKMNGEKQTVKDIKIFNREVFFPKKMGEGVFKLTNETHTIHLFGGSWLTDRQKRRGQNKIWIEVCRPFLRKIKKILINIVGRSTSYKIEIWIRNLLR